MHYTHDDFLNAIVAQPADRTLRLVFADWLDEHDGTGGEFVAEVDQLPYLYSHLTRTFPSRIKFGNCEWDGVGCTSQPLPSRHFRTGSINRTLLSTFRCYTSFNC